MIHEPKHLRDDGFDSKSGEWRDEHNGNQSTGGKWSENYREIDDYWEHSSENYTEYPNKKMFRSGVNEFKNNKKYLRVEHWEEHSDGRLVKKIDLDDGCGTKCYKKTEIKLNINKVPKIHMTSDKIYSLQDLILQNKKYV